MKLIKQANGKTTVKMSQREWVEMGKEAGWVKEANEVDTTCGYCDSDDVNIIQKRHCYIKRCNNCKKQSVLSK